MTTLDALIVSMLLIVAILGLMGATAMITWVFTLLAEYRKEDKE